MKYRDLKKLKLPDPPGIYMFMKGNEILYIGKATSLRARIRSYFSKDIVSTRGAHIDNMVRAAKTVRAKTTDSVLEALVLESYLIKKHKPKYNTDEKDDKSFNFIVITKETFPRVLVVRGRDLDNKIKNLKFKIKNYFGPFPKGGELREAVKLIRKIFPFRDKCIPALQGSTLGIQKGFYKGRSFVKPCFNRQIGLCPGVCSGEISRQDYSAQIRNLKLFLEGKKKTVVKNLEREMLSASKKHLFERAGELKQRLFSLNHIQDVALMKRESVGWRTGEIFRIESYDAAHMSGKNGVAVMTVIENGEVSKAEYRKFKLRTATEADDLSSLEEVLRRRFNHLEWRMPNIVVVDGGTNQKRRAEKVLKELGISVPVLAVVKNEFHKPRGILGDNKITVKHERNILLGNSEAHRFAIKFHRELRDRIKV